MAPPPTGEILRALRLGFPWETQDPFLFCVHHLDRYPAGNEVLGPAASLEGRNLGQDFEGKDGWRMYHGARVPGFPGHPHRGFETITVVRRGLVDHSDSLGAMARYGHGDVQWLTAGAGIQHSEMFPLLDRGGPNTLELFQIWLNLPAADKMAPPHFAMFWAPSVPRHVERDEAGREVEVTVVAGRLEGARPPAPPPRSWASRADAHVAVWTLRLAPGARFTLPAAPAGVNRTIYFFRGEGLRAAGHEVPGHAGLEVKADVPFTLEAGSTEAELLVLQGRPIGEEVAHYGPFVMNTEQELQQAFRDYQRTRFGGWPWSSEEPVFPRDQGRFARHVDGRMEQAPPGDGK
ncbi:MAG: pirin-like C-terminal cupin domain-containing protein [Anaeromyxobacter sp.]